MTDYFALLGQPRKPWLDPEQLKQKYHELARQSHPDKNVNEAYRTLADAKSRLQHLLALEGVALAASSNEIPEELTDLFMAIAPALNKIDNPNVKSVDDLIARVTQLYDQALAELQRVDSRWRKELPQLEKLYYRISYLTRWQTLLEERRFQLSTAP
jgi:curved DNA-binding protein CbpA